MPELAIHRKVIGVPLTKSLSKNEDGSVLVLGKFTSDNRDEVGDIITRSATERALPKYRMWGNIRYMHQPRPVGKVTRIGMENGLEWNEVEIKVIDPQAVFEIENGLLQALSVGILVNFEDVEMLADGGWVINDYSLAEISLVDHPANYDAALQLSLMNDAAVRSKAREMGVIPALRSLGINIDKGEVDMTSPAEEIKQEIEEQAEPVAVAQEEETAVEAVEEVAVEEKVVAVAEQPEALAAEQPEVVEEQKGAEVVDPQVQIANAMLTAAAAMQEVAKNLTGILSPKAEVVEAKAHEANEQPIKDSSSVDVEALNKQIADLQAQLTALTMPVDRKGQLPQEDVPEEQPAVEEVEEERPISLRDAVKMYAKSKVR